MHVLIIVFQWFVLKEQIMQKSLYLHTEYESTKSTTISTTQSTFVDFAYYNPKYNNFRMVWTEKNLQVYGIHHESESLH